MRLAALLIALLTAVGALRAEPVSLEKFTAHAWLLDGLKVQPESHAKAAIYKRQLGRTHPVGAFFLQLDSGRTYTLQRGADLRESGRWQLDDGVLALLRPGEAQPVRYRVLSVEDSRLVLQLVLPEGAPEVQLEFTAGRLPE
jgi:hypothetical protein